MIFNEDTRVKIPTILHLMRLGFNYLSLKNTKWDESTNIFTEILYGFLFGVFAGLKLPDSISDILKIFPGKKTSSLLS